MLKSTRLSPATRRRIDVSLNQFATTLPFQLDDFQQEAVRTLLAGDSVMVAAPTGSGKTVVAEFGIYDVFRSTARVFYTTPIKALSNQKYRDLRGIYGDEVGLLTGDVSENREARVIVMTTEILRNMLLQSPWELDDVDVVIFDEIHYLADPERGTTWEEAIILCPEHVQLICLSATVTNAGEIAQWISRTHRPIRLITHDQRPVPLALYYFHDKEMKQVVDHTGNTVASFANTGGEQRRARNNDRSRRSGKSRVAPELEEAPADTIVEALHKADMLPAIYFVFSRADCQTYADRMHVTHPNFVSRSMQVQINQIIERYLAILRPEDHELEQVQSITRLARNGIAFHHAGLLPILKQLVETLFADGLLQVVFATDTLALGVNMPARTVVIGKMTKWDGRRRRALTTNEFQQMAGRAGRRGMDAFGHVVVPHSPWMPYREMIEIATGPLEPVRSAFAVRYNTVLHLWDPPEGERVRQMLRQSLAQFQAGERLRQLEQDIVEVGGDIIAVTDDPTFRPDLIADYERIEGLLKSSRQSIRRLERELADEETDLVGATPWGEFNRQALRRLFRHAPPGVVLFHRDFGWGVFIARSESGGGIGLVFFGDRLESVSEYRQVLYVADTHRVDVPDDVTLQVVQGRVVSPADALAVTGQIDLDQLPDVVAEMDEFQQRLRARQAEDLVRTQDELVQVRFDHEALELELDRHPYHDSSLLAEHRERFRRVSELERERAGLEDLLLRESEAEEQRVQSVIWGIREVLHRFSYMRRGFATEKADMLAGVFDNDGLILCELVDRGVLAELPPEDLAEIFSWYSFDREMRYANGYTLSPELTDVRRKIEGIERSVVGEEREHRLFISTGHNPTFYGAARAWCTGQTMVEIAEKIALSEGDLVLTFNKTIDLIRQVREMLEDVLTGHPLIGPLRRAERLLCRGIVEQSLAIGFAPLAEVAQSAEPQAQAAPAST
jgi:ATP-dependent RNA helicase HelY